MNTNITPQPAQRKGPKSLLDSFPETFRKLFPLICLRARSRLHRSVQFSVWNVSAILVRFFLKLFTGLPLKRGIYAGQGRVCYTAVNGEIAIGRLQSLHSLPNLPPCSGQAPRPKKRSQFRACLKCHAGPKFLALSGRAACGLTLPLNAESDALSPAELAAFPTG